MKKWKTITAVLLIITLLGASYTALSYSSLPPIIHPSSPSPPVYFPSYLNVTVAGNRVSYLIYESDLQSNGLALSSSVVGHSLYWGFSVYLVSEKKANQYESIGVEVPDIYISIVNDSSHKEEQVPIWGGNSPSVESYSDFVTATMYFAIAENINDMAIVPGNYTAIFNVTLNLMVLTGPYIISSLSSVVTMTFPLVISDPIN